MQQRYDYLIVGQGLAGSLLAYELIEAGAKVLVIDNPAGPSSSKVAAGIFNPVTGKRFVKTWLCDEIYPNLISYYQSIENKFSAKFLNEIPIARPISNIKEQNFVNEISDEPENINYIEFKASPSEISTICNANFGILSTKIGGWVNVPVFLKTLNDFFVSKKIYFPEQFDYEGIKFENNELIYKNNIFTKVIFCEGYAAHLNPYFNWLPFNAVKGEVLDIGLDLPLANYILLNGIFLVPTSVGNYKLGATYNWQDKTYEPTDEAQFELLEKFEKIIKSKPSILAQSAGIRPATIDRRPFLGLHPKHNQIAVFNGLGTKGVSLGPYFAKHFSNFLIKNKQLMPEININRFSSLYLSSDFEELP